MYTSSMGKRGPKPRGKISTTWSSKLAYAVGLLAADGCVIDDGMYVNFTSKDLDLAETFKDCVGTQVKIGRKGRGGDFADRYCVVQFKDVLFHAWLADIGIRPRKSHTIGPLAIPDEYFFDFFRGCWDGDGTIYAYWDKRWRDSYMFYLGLASASKVFIEWVQATIFRLTGVCGHISVSANLCQLRYAKREAHIVFDHMFYVADVPHLARKFAKAQKIFRIDETHNAQVGELADPLP